MRLPLVTLSCGEINRHMAAGSRVGVLYRMLRDVRLPILQCTLTTRGSHLLPSFSRQSNLMQVVWGSWGVGGSMARSLARRALAVLAWDFPCEPCRFELQCKFLRATPSSSPQLFASCQSLPPLVQVSMLCR